MAELKTKSGESVPLSDESGLILGLRAVAAPLTKEHIHLAAIQYDGSSGEVDSFKDSTNYDVIVDEKRYPPKAILGLALTNYHGVRILSSHFKGGIKSECFRILEELGFETVEKEFQESKLKREVEVFDYSKFVVGESHTKLEAFGHGGVWVPRQGRDISGVTRFNNCVVLFVTLEKDRKEDEHKYNDKFFLGGSMFQWESQNNNTPDTPHMQMIIGGETVVLFARVYEKVKSKSQPFIYVGELRYVKHSYPIDSKDLPVEVIFEVSEHKESASEALSSLYEWAPGIDLDYKPIDVLGTVLTETSAPSPSRRSTNHKGKSKRTGKTNWAERDERNRNLGLAGEKLVIQSEIQKLIDLGRSDLADKVEHVAKDNDYAGYDVLSFDEQGNEKYIEVKTTKQSKGTAFFISRNEVEVSVEKGDQYWLYRVYNLDESTGVANFYSLQGPVDQKFELKPENFKASPK
ncbi:TPA: DUF3427 domain-containing protein [Vibrio parahaemolyticus]|nr:DUF3427 domain-containing protein [Vibrio vulnificus]HAS6610676.1 DUF3427 domain-containing protein [Vibrio parahaemolyticus]HAS6621288.1 DUF3427 domain-containing protein [Vibrio parahaemolyticus]HAS6631821.1 DUF3427 domain-containing protein [Vibrio parahaemolyticus]HAS6648317.1 DUF3427 domain-containing protein [Vibrio parahaemolyticus]